MPDDEHDGWQCSWSCPIHRAEPHGGQGEILSLADLMVEDSKVSTRERVERLEEYVCRMAEGRVPLYGPQGSGNPPPQSAAGSGAARQAEEAAYRAADGLPKSGYEAEQVREGTSGRLVKTAWRNADDPSKAVDCIPVAPARAVVAAWDAVQRGTVPNKADFLNAMAMLRYYVDGATAEPGGAETEREN